VNDPWSVRAEIDEAVEKARSNAGRAETVTRYFRTCAKRRQRPQMRE
jgi:hypothetical protein